MVCVRNVHKQAKGAGAPESSRHMARKKHRHCPHDHDRNITPNLVRAVVPALYVVASLIHLLR